MITECLRNNHDLKGKKIVGKVLSIFWDKKHKLPTSLKLGISSSLNRADKAGHIMWFSEFVKLFDCDLSKEEYESICKEMGKEI